MNKQETYAKSMEVYLSYKSLFDSPEGEIVLDDLCSQYYIEQSTIGSVVDKDLMMFREGQRSVVLAIKNMIKFDIEQFTKTYEENNKERE